MPPRPFIATAVFTLLNLAAQFAAWLVLVLALGWGFKLLPAQHYTRGDAISPIFEILVQRENGEIFAQRLRSWKSNETLVHQAHAQSNEFGIGWQLTPLAADEFELRVIRENTQLTQRYRITADNRVIPLLFKTLNNLAHIVLCFVLSFPLFALFKWLLRRLFRLPKPSSHPSEAA